MAPASAADSRAQHGPPLFPLFRYPLRTAPVYREDKRQAASPSAIFQAFPRDEDIVAPPSAVVEGKDAWNTKTIQSIGAQAENSGWKLSFEANPTQTQQDYQSSRLSRDVGLSIEQAFPPPTHFATRKDKMGMTKSRDAEDWDKGESAVSTYTAFDASRPAMSTKSNLSPRSTETPVSEAHIREQGLPPSHFAGKLSEDRRDLVDTGNMRYSTALNSWQVHSGERRQGSLSSAHPETSLSGSATFTSSSNLFDRRQQALHKQPSSIVVNTDRHQLIGTYTDRVEASTSLCLCKSSEMHLSDINEEGSITQQDYMTRGQNPVRVVPADSPDSVEAFDGVGLMLNTTSCDRMSFTQSPHQSISTSKTKPIHPLRIVTGGSYPVRDTSLEPPAARQSRLNSNTAASSSGYHLEDVPTPIASSCSSLFTGRSFSTTTSVPSTAGTSYPSSATCQMSTCTNAVSNDNALQLSQQQQQYTSSKEQSVTAKHAQGKISTTSSISRISRYSDFASPNSGNVVNTISPNRKYDSFQQSSCLNNRPPLVRSVSEDIPGSCPSSSSSRSPRSDIKHVRCALEQYNKDGPGHTETTNRYDSVPMGPRALTTPTFGSPCAVPSRSIYSSTPSEASSGEASNGVSDSSRSSISTAASSKRSSWCSPQAELEALPPISITRDGCTTISKHSTATTIVDHPTPQKRHTIPSSIEAAIPLSRYKQIPHQHFAGTSTFTSPDTSVALSSDISPDGAEVYPDNNTHLASFEPAVADAVRRAAAAVHQYKIAAERVKDRSAPSSAEHAHYSTGNTIAMQSTLMGACGNGYFGNAIRAKALAILDQLLPTISSTVHNEDVIGIAEYGSLNSLSSSLVPRVTSHFTSAHQAQDGNPPSFSITYSDGPGSDFRALMKQVDSTSYHDYRFHVLNAPTYSYFAARPFPAQVVPSRSVSVGISLMDIHCRRTPISSGLSAAAAAHNELLAFLNTRAMEIKKDGLLLLAFIQRHEDETVAAVAAGRSKRTGDQDDPDDPTFTSPIRRYEGLDDEKTMKGQNYLGPVSSSSPYPSSLTSQAMSAESETSSTSGLTSSSFSSTMSRARSESSPCRPCFKTEAAVRRSDIWSTIPALLAPCIQRLVSTGLVKSDTANHLLTLPLHPRTPAQTRAVLRAVQQQWRTEWSCGLTEPSVDSPVAASSSSSSSSSSASPSPSTPTPTTPFANHEDMSESLHHKLDKVTVTGKPPSSRHSSRQEDALLLAHPAYTAFQSTTLSRVQFAEHAIQFIRVLYDAHFRMVLKDYAKLSRSRVEEVLDGLNEVLREKLEETGRAPLSLELEVCMIALRRV